MENFTSPLQKYKRQPKLFIDLPSKGAWYSPQVAEKFEELEVQTSWVLQYVTNVLVVVSSNSHVLLGTQRVYKPLFPAIMMFLPF